MTTNRTASVSNGPSARAAASVGPPVAARSARPKALDYSAFRIINDRNIFDPNRNPRRSDSGPRPKPKTIESFSLVGIMAYEKGTFAFFDGTSSQYRKALKSADTIAGFKLAGIEGNAVKLSSTNKEVELKVGMQLRREEEGEWQLSSTQAEPYASSSATSASASAASNNSPTAAASGASAASSGSADDVLKRLMQRREQE